MTNPILSGCYSPYKHEKTFLFIFGYSDRWFGKLLPGYTHVALGEIRDGGVIYSEPLLYWCETYTRPLVKFELSNFEVIEVKVRRKRGNRLLKFQFQTCATVVQYLSGVNAGKITANGLYKRLMGKSKAWWLKRGVLEVRRWDLKPETSSEAL